MVHLELFSRLVNLLSFFTMITAFLMAIRGSLSGQVRIFAVQSSLLALLAADVGAFTGRTELIGLGALLVLIKVVAIPKVLNRAVDKIGLEKFASPYLGSSASLTICCLLVVVAFYVMAPIAASSKLPTAEAIPLAFADVLIGFFITVNRKRALTQILGFLMLENGVFLLALLSTYGVPFIVEIGVFLDVLVAVLILEVFIYRIKENFDSIDVRQLGKLRG